MGASANLAKVRQTAGVTRQEVNRLANLRHATNVDRIDAAPVTRKASRSCFGTWGPRLADRPGPEMLP